MSNNKQLNLNNLPLTKDQKKAVSLLSVGTFLEYFDVMLYVHMAVLLNELFFPKTDKYTEQLLGAFAFCSTYLLRPFGAIIFGWIGDNIGRKETVIITTFLMALSCFCMSLLPTYAQIGITASVAVTALRMLQGVSSMGEIIGAEIYLTETIPAPKNYPYVMMMALCSVLGGTVALGVASLATSSANFQWRYAFAFGGFVATIGYFARTSLREAPEFSNAKLRLKQKLASLSQVDQANALESLEKAPFPVKTFSALFMLMCGWPVCFYFTYVFCGQILKFNFGYSSEAVIYNNFLVSMVNLFSYFVLLYICRKIHPLKILKIKVFMFSLLTIVAPFIINYAKSPKEIFLLQCCSMLFILSTNPAVPITYSHIPILVRFRVGSLSFAISRSIMHIITGFGTVFLTQYFGNYGLYLIMLPMCACYAYSVKHFTTLEKQAGLYY